MPLFETTFPSQRFQVGSQDTILHPSSLLQIYGPSIHTTISLQKAREDRLRAESLPIPDPITGLALIDTGAAVTAVDERVCQRLGLSPVGVVTLAHAGGAEQRACYPIQLHFPGSPLPSFDCPVACSVNLSGGNQPHILLLGRDTLSRIKMTYNGPAGRIELAF